MDEASGRLLLKGIEDEVFTGTPGGQIVPLSHRIVADLPGTSVEPDARNVEHRTDPTRDYLELGRALLRGRARLRGYLAERGGWTLVPGATLSLGDSRRFFRAQPGNDYHRFIEQTYGSTVVTTSEHLNVGVAGAALFRAYRLLRMEACLFLALSAGSPFLDRKVTGLHSTRWRIFPRTPERVPLFADHQQYRSWVREQLASRTMQNVRHCWISARVNGKRVPDELERLELRICDSVPRLDQVLGLCALLEARVQQTLEDSELDPSRVSSLSEDQLLALAGANELAVSVQSLDAELRHWRDGRLLSTREWLGSLLVEIEPVARARGLVEWLKPLQGILADGNTAQRWLAKHRAGQSPSDIVRVAVREMDEEERRLRSRWS